MGHKDDVGQTALFGMECAVPDRSRPAGFIPGPWEIVARGRGPLDPITVRRRETSGAYVCELRPSLSDDPSVFRATAALIEAAPDMLAALEACEEVLRLIHEAAGPVPKDAPMPGWSTFSSWLVARRAIEKARATPTPSVVTTSNPSDLSRLTSDDS